MKESEEKQKSLKAESKQLKTDASNAQNQVKQHKLKNDRLVEELKEAEKKLNSFRKR